MPELPGARAAEQTHEKTVLGWDARLRVLSANARCACPNLPETRRRYGAKGGNTLR